MPPRSAPSYRLLWIGRRAQDPLCAAAAEYGARLSIYVQLEVKQLRATAALLPALDRRRRTIVLDVAGRARSSTELAAHLAHWRDVGWRQADFVVGGAEGLPATVRAQAQELWSLGPMTLPHRLAQVVLTEQLYRAHSILAGAPYHK